LKYAIVSDIHSNLQALHAVLRDIDNHNCDVIISLGDIVGYGGEPNECIGLLREISVTSIKGNHDRVAAGIEEPVNFNPIAREAALWTRDNLTYGNKEYLNNLPDNKDYGEFIIVHGAISDPDKYINGIYEAETEFDLLGGAEICFFGHTHVSAVYARTNRKVRNIYVNKIPPDKSSLYIELEKHVMCLINPGSVGQPRDRDPRASYIVYDNSGSVEFRRVGYDVESAQKKIIGAGLDRALAERLSYGY